MSRLVASTGDSSLVGRLTNVSAKNTPKPPVVLRTTLSSVPGITSTKPGRASLPPVTLFSQRAVYCEAVPACRALKFSLSGLSSNGLCSGPTGRPKAFDPVIN